MVVFSLREGRSNLLRRGRQSSPPCCSWLPGWRFHMDLSANYVMKRRERQFRRDMERLGRTMLWPDFVRKSSEKNGTLIVAVDSHKGPVRWWWTSENLAGLSIDSAKVRCSDLFGKVEEAVLIVGKRDKAEAIAVRRKLRWIELGPQRRYGARTKRHVLTSGQSVPGFAVPSE